MIVMCEWGRPALAYLEGFVMFELYEWELPAWACLEGNEYMLFSMEECVSICVCMCVCVYEIQIRYN